MYVLAAIAETKISSTHQPINILVVFILFFKHKWSNNRIKPKMITVMEHTTATFEKNNPSLISKNGYKLKGLYISTNNADNTGTARV